MPTTLLLPTVLLALPSFLCTIFVLLRLLLPTIPAHPRSTSHPNGKRRLSNVRTSAETGRSSLTLVNGPGAAASKHRKTASDGTEKFLAHGTVDDEEVGVGAESKKLRSAQRLVVYVAIADQASLGLFIAYVLCYSTASANPLGAAGRVGAPLLCLALLLRPSLLALMACASWARITLGSAPALGKGDYRLWLTSITIALFISGLTTLTQHFSPRAAAALLLCTWGLLSLIAIAAFFSLAGAVWSARALAKHAAVSTMVTRSAAFRQQLYVASLGSPAVLRVPQPPQLHHGVGSTTEFGARATSTDEGASRTSRDTFGQVKDRRADAYRPGKGAAYHQSTMLTEGTSGTGPSAVPSSLDAYGSVGPRKEALVLQPGSIASSGVKLDDALLSAFGKWEAPSTRNKSSQGTSSGTSGKTRTNSNSTNAMSDVRTAKESARTMSTLAEADATFYTVPAAQESGDLDGSHDVQLYKPSSTSNVRTLLLPPQHDDEHDISDLDLPPGDATFGDASPARIAVMDQIPHTYDANFDGTFNTTVSTSVDGTLQRSATLAQSSMEMIDDTPQARPDSSADLQPRSATPISFAPDTILDRQGATSRMSERQGATSRTSDREPGYVTVRSLRSFLSGAYSGPRGARSATPIELSVQGGGEDMLGASGAVWAAVEAAQAAEARMNGRRATFNGGVGFNAEEERFSRQEARRALARIGGYLVGVLLPFTLTLPYLVMALIAPTHHAPLVLPLLMACAVALTGPLLAIQLLLTDGPGFTLLDINGHSRTSSHSAPLSPRSFASLRPLRLTEGASADAAPVAGNGFGGANGYDVPLVGAYPATPIHAGAHGTFGARRGTVVQDSPSRSPGAESWAQAAALRRSGAEAKSVKSVGSVPYDSAHWTSGRVEGARVVESRRAFVRAASLLWSTHPRLEVLPSGPAPPPRAKSSLGLASLAGLAGFAAKADRVDATPESARRESFASYDVEAPVALITPRMPGAMPRVGIDAAPQRTPRELELDGLSAMLLPKLVPGLHIGPDVRIADDDERTLCEEYDAYQRGLSASPTWYSFAEARSRNASARCAPQDAAAEQSVEEQERSHSRAATVHFGAGVGEHGRLTPEVRGERPSSVSWTGDASAEVEPQQSAVDCAPVEDVSTSSFMRRRVTTHPQNDLEASYDNSAGPTAEHSRLQPSLVRSHSSGRSSSLSVSAGHSLVSQAASIISRSRPWSHKSTVSLPLVQLNISTAAEDESCTSAELRRADDDLRSILVDSPRQSAVMEVQLRDLTEESHHGSARHDPAREMEKAQVAATSTIQEPASASRSKASPEESRIRATGGTPAGSPQLSHYHKQPAITPAGDVSHAPSAFSVESKRSLADEMGMLGSTSKADRRRSFTAPLSTRRHPTEYSAFASDAASRRRSLGSEMGLLLEEGSDRASGPTDTPSKRTTCDSFVSSSFTLDEDILISPDRSMHSRSASGHASVIIHSMIREEVGEGDDAAMVESLIADIEASMGDEQQVQELESDMQVQQDALAFMDPLTLHRHLYPALPLDTLEEVTEDASNPSHWDADVRASLDQVWSREHQREQSIDGSAQHAHNTSLDSFRASLHSMRQQGQGASVYSQRPAAQSHVEVLNGDDESLAERSAESRATMPGTPSSLASSFGWAEVVQTDTGAAVPFGKLQRARGGSNQSAITVSSQATPSRRLGLASSFWISSPPPLPFDASDAIKAHAIALREAEAARFEQEADWVEEQQREAESEDGRTAAALVAAKKVRRRTATSVFSFVSSAKRNSTSLSPSNSSSAASKRRSATSMLSHLAMTPQSSRALACAQDPSASPWALVNERPDSNSFSPSFSLEPASVRKSLSASRASTASVAATPVRRVRRKPVQLGLALNAAVSGDHDAGAWAASVQGRIDTWKEREAARQTQQTTPRRTSVSLKCRARPRVAVLTERHRFRLEAPEASAPDGWIDVDVAPPSADQASSGGPLAEITQAFQRAEQELLASKQATPLKAASHARTTAEGKRASITASPLRGKPSPSAKSVRSRRTSRGKENMGNTVSPRRAPHAGSTPLAFGLGNGEMRANTRFVGMR